MNISAQKTFLVAGAASPYQQHGRSDQRKQAGKVSEQCVYVLRHPTASFKP
ncbi:hypothetical protein Sphch_3342 [Sphingobium chlorophenolicum L-1]|uniref:Uncharacterized protein n=1 Tax=Sphingobium chlorophenolicum L-1 TaxID=690566 RepID=F6F3C6_SPHCR|nr:hypothetical protein [Sphingobium chlorophenolicum]AEG50938.1 hypothetical protein Sphch_3342 [Sphingobium chlorophenolicum L-1]